MFSCIKLLRFDFRHDQLTLDTRLEPLCQQILLNNSTSGNVGSLIQVFLLRAAELLASARTEKYAFKLSHVLFKKVIFFSDMFAWQIYNALFVIRCITKYLVETVSEVQLVNHFEASSPEHGKLEAFLDALIELVVDVPLKYDFS